MEASRENRSEPTRRVPEKELSELIPKETWGCSSVGRAPALQAGGHGFESHHLHQAETKTGS